MYLAQYREMLTAESGVPLKKREEQWNIQGGQWVDEISAPSPQMLTTPIGSPAQSPSPAFYRDPFLMSPPSVPQALGVKSLLRTTSYEGKSKKQDKINGHVWVRLQGEINGLHEGQSPNPILSRGKDDRVLLCNTYSLTGSGAAEICCDMGNIEPILDFNGIMTWPRGANLRKNRMDLSRAIYRFIRETERSKSFPEKVFQEGNDEASYSFEGGEGIVKKVGAGTSIVVFKFIQASLSSSRENELLNSIMPKLAFRRVYLKDEIQAKAFYFHLVAHDFYLNENEVVSLKGQYIRSGNVVYIIQKLLNRENILENYFKDTLLGLSIDDEITVLGKFVSVGEFIESVTSLILSGIQKLAKANEKHKDIGDSEDDIKLHLAGYVDAKYANYAIYLDDDKGDFFVKYMDPYPVHLMIFDQQPTEANGRPPYMVFDSFYHKKGASDALVHNGMVAKYLKKFRSYSNELSILLKLASDIIDTLYGDISESFHFHSIINDLKEKRSDRYKLIKIIYDTIARKSAESKLYQITSSDLEKKAIDYWVSRVKSNMLMRLSFFYTRKSGWDNTDEVINARDQFVLSQTPDESRLIKWVEELVEDKDSTLFRLMRGEHKHDPDHVIPLLRSAMNAYVAGADYKKHGLTLKPVIDEVSKPDIRPVQNRDLDVVTQTSIVDNSPSKYRKSSIDTGVTSTPAVMSRSQRPKQLLNRMDETPPCKSTRFNDFVSEEKQHNNADQDAFSVITTHKVVAARCLQSMFDDQDACFLDKQSGTKNNEENCSVPNDLNKQWVRVECTKRVRGIDNRARMRTDSKEFRLENIIYHENNYKMKSESDSSEKSCGVMLTDTLIAAGEWESNSLAYGNPLKAPKDIAQIRSTSNDPRSLLIDNGKLQTYLGMLRSENDSLVKDSINKEKEKGIDFNSVTNHFLEKKDVHYTVARLNGLIAFLYRSRINIFLQRSVHVVNADVFLQIMSIVFGFDIYITEMGGGISHVKTYQYKDGGWWYARYTSKKREVVEREIANRKAPFWVWLNRASPTGEWSFEDDKDDYLKRQGNPKIPKSGILPSENAITVHKKQHSSPGLPRKTGSPTNLQSGQDPLLWYRAGAFSPQAEAYVFGEEEELSLSTGRNSTGSPLPSSMPPSPLIKIH